MGNFVSYYKGNGQIRISDSGAGDYTIYAFTIYDVDISASDITEMFNGWSIHSVVANVSNPSNWDITFIHLAGEIAFNTISDIKIAFIDKVSTDLDGSNLLRWYINEARFLINDYNYGNTVNVSESNGGGDPHIVPHLNPLGKTYILNASNECYRLFEQFYEHPDTGDYDRIVCNASVWAVGFEYISFVNSLKNSNSPSFKKYADETYKYHIKRNRDVRLIDNSFFRYIYFAFIRNNQIIEELTVDMDSLASVKPTLEEIHDMSISCKEVRVKNNLVVMSKIDNSDVIVGRNVYIRIGNNIVTFELLTYPLRPNFRNSVNLKFADEPDEDKSRGLLYNIEHADAVNNLFNIAEAVGERTICRELTDYQTDKSWYIRQIAKKYANRLLDSWTVDDYFYDVSGILSSEKNSITTCVMLGDTSLINNIFYCLNSNIGSKKYVNLIVDGWRPEYGDVYHIARGVGVDFKYDVIESYDNIKVPDSNTVLIDCSVISDPEVVKRFSKIRCRHIILANYDKIADIDTITFYDNWEKIKSNSKVMAFKNNGNAPKEQNKIINDNLVSIEVN